MSPALAMVLLGAMLVAASSGAVHVAPTSIVRMGLARLGVGVSTGDGAAAEDAIVFEVRLPRVVTAALVGAALSTAGVLLQALLRNPLADPYAIGTSGGAALGATLALVASTTGVAGGFALVPLCAFAGAMATTAFVYAMARAGGRTPVVSIVLTGLVVSLSLGYVMSLVLLLLDRYQRDTRVMYAWLLGGIIAAPWPQVALLAVLVSAGCATAVGWSRHLDTLALGEERAAALGLDVERYKAFVMATAALLTAAAVSAGGLIGFVGLVVPHVGRLLCGPGHARLLPVAMLGGAAFLVLADLAARTVVAPMEIPLGIVTALGGGPVFLYLLRRSRRDYRF